MYRSRRKTPIFGHTSAETDHPWKKRVARKLRRRVKQHLDATLDGDRIAGSAGTSTPTGRPTRTERAGGARGPAKRCASEVAPRAPHALIMKSMKRIVVALLALAAVGCGERDDTRAAPIRMPLAVASAATPSAIPAAPAGPLVWTHAQSARAAWVGPADAPALLAIACEGWEKRSPRLRIVRYARADKGAEALFAIQGSKGILRLPVSATKVGDSGYVWRGFLDAADPRAEVLLGNGLKATVPGGGMIELPPMGAAGALVGECAAATAPPAPADAQTLPNLASKPATSPAAR